MLVKVLSGVNQFAEIFPQFFSAKPGTGYTTTFWEVRFQAFFHLLVAG